MWEFISPSLLCVSVQWPGLSFPLESFSAFRTLSLKAQGTDVSKGGVSSSHSSAGSQAGFKMAW